MDTGAACSVGSIFSTLEMPKELTRFRVAQVPKVEGWDRWDLYRQLNQKVEEFEKPTGQSLRW